MRNKGFLIAVSLLQFNLLKNIIFPDFISLTFCLEIPQQLQIGKDYCCAKHGLCKRLSLERLVPEVTRVMSKHQRIKCISHALLDDGVLRNMVFAGALNHAKPFPAHALPICQGQCKVPGRWLLPWQRQALVQGTVVKDVLSLIQILAAAMHTGWY